MFHYSDYLREQAAKYRELAEKNEDAFVKQEFIELADTNWRTYVNKSPMRSTTGGPADSRYGLHSGT